MDKDSKLGRKFWLFVIGAALAVGIGAAVIVLVIGAVWYAWGILGALLFFFGAMLAGAYLYDRKQAKAYNEPA